MIMKPSLIVYILTIICCIVTLSSCSTKLVSVQHTEIALGTYVKLIVITEKHNRDQAQETMKDVYDLVIVFEGTFDYRSSDGELSRFNAGTLLHRKEHTPLFELVRESLEFADITGGYFDPTILPIKEAWGFDTGSPDVPRPEDLERALHRVDHTQVSIGGGRILKPEDVQLDLSGIAKGKIVDMARDLLRDAGFSDFLVDAGGDIFVSGRNLNRTKWRVAIQDPVQRDRYSGVVEKSDAAIVTSGDYENFFVRDGKRYSHLLNPFTGYSDSDIKSVTIIASDTAFGDAIATAVFTMGSREGHQFLLEHGIEGTWY
jgi:thiamine biosynthesis lipoprotein